MLHCAHPASLRGAYASSRTLSARCDGRCDAWRFLRKTTGTAADGEVVWSWHPDADAKPPRAMSRAATVANKPGTPGRVRISRKANRAGKAGYLAVPVVLPRAFLMHADHGYQSVPGLSCALLLDEGEMLAKLGRKMRRENGDPWFRHCEAQRAEAIQGCATTLDCFRRRPSGYGERVASLAMTGRMRPGLDDTYTVVMPAKAGIQYAAASRSKITVSGILDHPPSRVMTPEIRREEDAKTGLISSDLSPLIHTPGMTSLSSLPI
jgi:hypothetical protein